MRHFCRGATFEDIKWSTRSWIRSWFCYTIEEQSWLYKVTPSPGTYYSAFLVVLEAHDRFERLPPERSIPAGYRQVSWFAISQRKTVIPTTWDAQKFRRDHTNFSLYNMYVQFLGPNVQKDLWRSKKSIIHQNLTFTLDNWTATPHPTTKTPQGKRSGARGNGPNLIMIAIRGWYHSS